MKIIPLSENRYRSISRKSSLLSAQQNPVILDEQCHSGNSKLGDLCRIDIVSNPTIEYYDELNNIDGTKPVIERRTNAPNHMNSNTVCDIDTGRENNCSATIESENSIQRRPKIERHSSVETILRQSGSLVSWPAINLNSLIQQTIIRCTDTMNGKQKLETSTIPQTSSKNDEITDINVSAPLDSDLCGGNEIIL